MQACLARERREIAHDVTRLAAAHPAARLARASDAVAALERRLVHAVARPLADVRARLGTVAGKLDVLSPLGSLARGYAIVRRDDGQVVRAAASLAPGDVVGILLARGRARARIIDTEDGE
jgi:exodeoxyribonuclease VII large subunit